MEPVQVERFYLGCLAHASYMVGSEGVAAIIDPQRDVDIYLEGAERKRWKIEHIIETHVHADFVSGHRELAERASISAQDPELCFLTSRSRTETRFTSDSAVSGSCKLLDTRSKAFAF